MSCCVRRRRGRAVRVEPLTFWERLDLRIGPMPDHWGTDRIRWTTDAERRAAWFANRDELLARRTHPGRRPAAFWQYEAPHPDPEGGLLAGITSSVAYLAEHDLLEPWEIAAIHSPRGTPPEHVAAAQAGLIAGLARVPIR